MLLFEELYYDLSDTSPKKTTRQSVTSDEWQQGREKMPRPFIILPPPAVTRIHILWITGVFMWIIWGYLFYQRGQIFVKILKKKSMGTIYLITL